MKFYTKEELESPTQCGATCFAGPPMYAARCKLSYKHEGDHKFPTRAEAYYDFYGKPLEGTGCKCQRCLSLLPK